MRQETALPKLFYDKLPPDMPSYEVVLCDPMLATGGSALMAIDVLKKAGVLEEVQCKQTQRRRLFPLLPRASLRHQDL